MSNGLSENIFNYLQRLLPLLSSLLLLLLSYVPLDFLLFNNIKYVKITLLEKNMEEKESNLFNTVYREIGAELGLDAAIRIYQMFKGQQITFPIHLFDSKLIQRNIIREYDGGNIRELAKKYGYSEKTIRRVIKDSLEEG